MINAVGNHIARQAGFASGDNLRVVRRVGAETTPTMPDAEPSESGHGIATASSVFAAARSTRSISCNSTR